MEREPPLFIKTVITVFKIPRPVSYTHLTLPTQIKVWLQDGMLMGEIRSNEALKERYRLKEENHHYTKETDGYYRNSFVYQVLSDSDGKELQKNLILQNHSKVLFDPALIPQEELRL